MPKRKRNRPVDLDQWITDCFKREIEGVGAFVAAVWDTPPGRPLPQPFDTVPSWSTDEEKFAYLRKLDAAIPTEDRMLTPEEVEQFNRLTDDELLIERINHPSRRRAIQALHWQCVENVLRDFLREAVLNYTFRAAYPALHCDYRVAIDKAAAGDEQHMLALLSLFPLLSQDEPRLDAALNQMRTNPGFLFRYREVVGQPPKLDYRTKRHLLSIFALCMTPDLVRNRRTSEIPTQLTLSKLMDMLQERGVDVDREFGERGAKSLGEFLLRRFPDWH